MAIFNFGNTTISQANSGLTTAFATNGDYKLNSSFAQSASLAALGKTPFYWGESKWGSKIDKVTK